MTRRILVALDDSDRSDAVLEYALDVHAGGEFVLFHVVNPERWISTGDEGGDVYYSEETKRAVERAADDLLAGAAETARAAGADVETVRVAGRPASAILDYLDDHPVDGVVMGSRGRTGIDRLLLGSVAESVVRRSPVPVTVVR